tara:strand:+ start:8 stop:148 length:141 start_codon:yes stop_codon:yes gene_type:complete
MAQFEPSLVFPIHDLSPGLFNLTHIEIVIFFSELVDDVRVIFVLAI